MANDWLAAVKGHVTRFRQDIAEQLKQRITAEKLPNSRIITREDIRNGPAGWDANRVLYTTLGGTLRELTASDLRSFQRNIQTYRKEYKELYGGRPAREGITAQQVINIASGKPLKYKKPEQYVSDIDKARREITSCVPVSATRDTVRFITNAGPESLKNSHTVIVKFLGYSEALAEISEVDATDKKAVSKAVRKMLRGYLKFDCDCERHRYFFRYVATIGGWAAGYEEHGYPKIRNPHLKGVACKHVIRVMADIINSQVVQKFLERHLLKIETTRTTTQVGKNQAKKMAERKRPVRIKTSQEIARERKIRNELRKTKTSIEKQVKVKKAQKKPPVTVKKAAESRKFSRKVESAIRTFMETLGETREQVIKRMGLENVK